MMELLQYDFFVNALIAAVFVSVSCGIIGTYIVSRRMVFIGGGMTHSSFGGIGVAYFLGINPLIGAGVFAVLSALGINYFTKKGNIREDSSIAIWWSLGMAIGIVFVAITPGSSPNLMSFLFGSILTVSDSDLIFMALHTTVIVAVFSVFIKLIKLISFDEEFAKSRNLPVTLFNNLLMIITALAIVAAIRVSGVILVLSMLTLPQTLANIFTKKFESIILISIAVGFIAVVSGLVFGFFFNLPSGATIVIVLTLLLLICKVIQRFCLQRR